MLLINFRDIDECTAYAEYDYDENRSVSKSICSHSNTDVEERQCT